MKTDKIEFRCSKFEKKIYKKKAQKAGLSLSEFCRISMNRNSVKSRLTFEQIELYRMLVKYHNNFKSIGNLIKKKHPDLYVKVYQTAEEIKAHLNNFK